MTASTASEAILVVDQGTTNSKALLVGRAGAVLARGECAVPIEHPRPGWVQQDAEAIWQSVCAAVAACMRDRDENIVGIGISCQRESFVAWNARDGRAIAPCITWQCRRSAEQCEKLRAAGAADFVQGKTGLPLDPLFSAGKAHWLASQSACAPADLRMGTVDSWLLAKITGGAHACDESNASRTQLFDIRGGEWDDALCELFEVPRAALPRVLPSDAEFGVACAPPFPRAPVRAMLGDSHAALLGHGIIAPGAVKATYGTGSSLMTPLPAYRPPTNGLTTTIAWHAHGRRMYAAEGNISVCASSLPWAAKLLGLGGDNAGDAAGKIAAIAESVGDSAGVFFVPALVGLGAPHWRADARGLFCGLTFNAGPAHLARAVLESIPLQVQDVFAAMANASATKLTALCADGGPSGNPWLMQLQADILDAPVHARAAAEASAFGAAGLAGVAAGLWRGLEEFSAVAAHAAGAKFTPAMPPPHREELLHGWQQAVSRALLSNEKPA